MNESRIKMNPTKFGWIILIFKFVLVNLVNLVNLYLNP